MSGARNLLAFSPDGTIILVTSDNYFSVKTIKLLDVETGKSLGELSGHTESITTLVYSHDGKILASGSDDGTVLLWDWEKIVGRIKVEKL